MPVKYSFAVYEATGNYATGARSLASSSAVVLCTTSGGRLHMKGIVPAGRWFGASLTALTFCCATKALVPRGEWQAPGIEANTAPGGGAAKGMLLMK